MNTILKLSARNLSRSKKRSVILAIAIAFGFFIVTLIDGLASGAINNFEEQITQMLGGSVLIAGYEKTPKDDGSGKSNLTGIIRDGDYISNLLKENNIKYEYASKYTTSSGQLLFNSSKSMTTVYGRDFKQDKDFIDSLQIVSGDITNLENPDAIILSQDMAETLNIAVGDSILYTTRTIYGQNNVGEFTVALTIKGSSLLAGSSCYANIDAINALVDMPQGAYSMYTLYITDKKEQTLIASQIEQLIRNDGIEVSDRALALQTNPTNIGKGIDKQFTSDNYKWEGTKYAIETLNDEVPQIQQIMNIVHVVTTIILVVILLIVMVGISNTYRMVLYERIREIGTMRALGMSGKDTGRVFTTEALILCILGAAAGLLLAVAVMILLSFIPIHSQSVSFFLHKGHMTFSLSAGSIIIQYILMIILTAIAVRGSAKKAAGMSPAEALRTVK